MKYRREEPDEEEDYEYMYDFVQKKLGWSDEQMALFNVEVGEECEWNAVHAIWYISNKERIDAELEAEYQYVMELGEELMRERENGEE